MNEKILNPDLQKVYPRTTADVSAERKASEAAAANAWDLYVRGQLKHDPDKSKLS